ncbi:MAG: DinB family protein [Bacteroidota bacterium]
MNLSQLLSQQTRDAYDWTHKLLDSIPISQWEQTPDILDTNVIWQAGHLLMSHYFHAIMVISGHRKDIISQIPLREYNGFFTAGDPRKVLGQCDPESLRAQLKQVQQATIEEIDKLSETDLQQPLEPTPTPHPIAKTKYEAIDWNIKHTMWHCGQLGTLKRVIGEPYNFGLRPS